MTRPAPEPVPDDLEASTDDVIAACEGDARAAVRVLLVALHHCQAELEQRNDEVAQLAQDISRGYSRGRWEDLLTRAEVPIPYKPDD
ncbi:hypothetical protein FZC33_11185 [Labrys sp. KNU-23]|uniref:hypothetical protein n=1 Tax=Labrys sp. KNU-23 TaxID=2789216 RepID=UPI0011EFF0DD|nr:hypothetical protein [Labrys sp. KNU-23]QEN86854.1 hypothetical protein FZC33_11185 [Labrys sp. KNU-23]